MTEDEKKRKKVATQGTLDGLLIVPVAPVVPTFTRENLLHMVTQFVAVDDQVRPITRSQYYGLILISH